MPDTRSVATFSDLRTRAPDATFARLGPGLIIATGGAALAVGVNSLVPAASTLVVAVVLGAVAGNSGLAGVAAQPGLAFASRRLLRAGVVLLGLRLSLGDVLQLGWRALIVVGLTVAVTFFGTQVIGRHLGVSRDLSLLVATGFSICGASAIAAVESSTDADEDEVAAAIGLVTLFGTMAIFVLPVLADLTDMTGRQFGAWAGASVHDVAQVAATASAGGAPVVATAMVVKLTRVVLLTPIVIGVNLRRRGGPTSATEDDMAGHETGTPERALRRTPIVPLFVASFIAMVALRSSGLVPDGVIFSVRMLEGWLLATALVGLGAGVRLGQLRRLGSAPLVLGLLAWALVAATSYLGVTIGSPH